MNCHFKSHRGTHQAHTDRSGTSLENFWFPPLPPNFLPSFSQTRNGLSIEAKTRDLGETNFGSASVPLVPANRLTAHHAQIGGAQRRAHRIPIQGRQARTAVRATSFDLTDTVHSHQRRAVHAAQQDLPWRCAHVHEVQGEGRRALEVDAQRGRARDCHDQGQYQQRPPV